jgi:hypothetical protein
MGRAALATFVTISLLGACVSRIERKVSADLATVDLKAPFLKAHMRDGDLYVLSSWTIDEAEAQLLGTGERFGPARGAGVAGTYRVRFADVALYETNTVIRSPVVAAMAVVTGASVVVTVACLANPKACFGSCPTFYATTDEGQRFLQAEGFSDSIAPSLERNDVDALWRSTGRGGELSLLMTNEAYETHVVKQADVLAVPRPPGGRVLADASGLWAASALRPASRCRSTHGDCLDLVRAVDGRERTTVTDPDDLAARETIELAFEDDGPGGAGRALVVGARQTLVTTFLLYQGLSYLGGSATAWLARGERGQRIGPAVDLSRLLGGIEVQVPVDDGWQTVGEVYETGPIATDVHLVRLPAGVSGRALRLRLPKGGWRLDYLALAELAGAATAIRVSPTRVHGTLGRDYGAGRSAATGFPIVTMPGDEYELRYQLPPGEDYELFLDSRGYYLEWMRQQWLREENPLAALRMLLSPRQALRTLAPAFKEIEPQAEELFWRSRYARPL